MTTIQVIITIPINIGIYSNGTKKYVRALFGGRELVVLLFIIFSFGSITPVYLFGRSDSRIN